MIKRILNKIKKFIFEFKPNVEKNYITSKIGTIYGGYNVYEKNLKKPVVISCGLGEDATFDVEMIKKHDAKIICIDPTPRAKDHYFKITKNFGIKNQYNYDESGNLNVKCYDLVKVNENNFLFIFKAIWKNSSEKLKLFFPQNEEAVSCSINFDPNSNTSFFLSDTIYYDEILKDHNLKQVDILKLDIEGAEIEVLKNILTSKNLPKQILVEFDIRRRPNYKNKKILLSIHKKILQNYNLININKKGDFTYLLKNYD